MQPALLRARAAGRKSRHIATRGRSTLYRDVTTMSEHGQCDRPRNTTQCNVNIYYTPTINNKDHVHPRTLGTIGIVNR